MNTTVVAVFINNGKLLMNKRSESRKVYAGYLMCPSGHVEDGESLRDALKREMKEELGIKIGKSKFLFTIDDVDQFSGLDFRHNFMLVETYEGEIAGSKEGGLIWMSYEELSKIKLVPIVGKLVVRLKESNKL